MHLPDFKSSRVLIAGDLMLDRFWHGATSRISPEAPVPVVRIHDREDRAGGGGNVAINVASLGSTVTVMGSVGEDEAGKRLIQLLESSKVHCLIVSLMEMATITKLRVISRHQQLIRLDFEDDAKITTRQNLDLKTYKKALGATDVVVLSDYGKGALADPQALIAAAKSAGKIVLVDPKGTDFSKYRGATVLTPNRHEFEMIAGPTHHDQDLVTQGEKMREALELEALLITRGDEGMTLIERGKEALHLPARAKDVFDVTGAGDTVIATLACALASGSSLHEATQIANVAAGIVVGKLGTATVSPAEIQREIHNGRAPSRGQIELDRLIHECSAARARGEMIVLTNGCFDILHPGHVDYLTRARALGDRLIILVNSDASVQRLKGKDRPINPVSHRLAMLEALECVDWVLSFEEDTPRSMIAQILPDILVKGGDYRDISEIAGHDLVKAHGGRVEILNFLEGHSTTAMIEKIQSRQENVSHG